MRERRRVSDEQSCRGFRRKPMGSYRSGRRRTINAGTVEDHPAIDLRWLRRQAPLRSGTSTCLDLSWVHQPSNATVARCIVRFSISDDGAGYLQTSQSPTVLRQGARIVVRPTVFGGRRSYYVCPTRGHLCEVLYLRDGIFASRQAHRLVYRSQSRPSLEKRLQNLRDRSRRPIV